MVVDSFKDAGCSQCASFLLNLGGGYGGYGGGYGGYGGGYGRGKLITAVMRNV